MEVKLNDTQKELLKMAEEKGFLTFEDFERFYTSPISQKANMRKFMLNGFVKDINSSGQYEFIRGKK